MKPVFHIIICGILFGCFLSVLLAKTAPVWAISFTGAAFISSFLLTIREIIFEANNKQ